MILKFIIQAFLGLASFLLSTFIGSLSSDRIFDNLMGAFEVFSDILTMSGQFVYFMLGDYLFIILPLLIPLLVYKYLVYPVAKFLIGFVRWGN